jgi:two-component system, chemotaxis family, response regulator Rcp1
VTVRILLVEDNPADVYLIRQALGESQLDHQLIVKTDGDEALKFIEEADSAADGECPGIILLDLNLPKIDGEIVLQSLRHSRKCAEAPVIVITSSDARKDREKVARWGATYFRKPSEFDEFMKLGLLVRTAIEHQAAAAPSSQAS